MLPKRMQDEKMEGPPLDNVEDGGLPLPTEHPRKETTESVPPKGTGTIPQQTRTRFYPVCFSTDPSPPAQSFVKSDAFQSTHEESTITRKSALLHSSGGTSPMPLEVYDTKDEIGRADLYGHGYFQRIILFCFIVSVIVLHCHTLAFTIIARRVEHWCKRPERFDHLTVAQWKNVGIPLEADGSYSRCRIYNDPLSANRTPVSCTAWEYERTSIVSTWDLVCSREWLVSYAWVIYMLGAATALPAVGTAADQIGRYPVVCLAVGFLLVSGFATYFATNFHFFVCIRGVVSGGVSTIFVNIFILLFEVTAHEYRTFYVTTGASFGFVISGIILNTIGQLRLHWTTVQLVLMLISSPLTCTFYFIEESPRWLLTARKTKRAEKALLWATKLNGEPLERAMEKYRMLNESLSKRNDFRTPPKATPAVLFRSTVLRWRCGMLYLCWFVVMFSYYGILETDVDELNYWATIVNIVSPAPLVAAAYFAMNRVGRKIVFVMAVGLLGLSSIALIILSAGTFLSNIFFVVAHGATTVAVAVIILYTAELFPTVVRSIGMCCAYSCGRLGAATAIISSPNIISPNITMALIGISVVIGEFALSRLPETLSRPLANTVKEIERGDFKKHLQDTLPSAACGATERRRASSVSSKIRRPSQVSVVAPREYRSRRESDASIICSRVSYMAPREYSTRKASQVSMQSLSSGRPARSSSSDGRLRRLSSVSSRQSFQIESPRD
ncbi:solute carrier family 22 member 7-like [Ornithodoros turicata]|uniref:solute carrier family 22 member 7-like n=1 Tax=Ornithodoros turicata TaxID=34597 RepID=UPI00313869EA